MATQRPGAPLPTQYKASRRLVPPELEDILRKSQKAIDEGKTKKANKLLAKSEELMNQMATKGVADSGLNKIPDTGVRRLNPWSDSPGIRVGGHKTRRRRMRGGAVDVWKVVGAVCEALGLKGSCSLATPQPDETKAVEELSPQPFEQWGPPPELPGEEMTFIIPDPGKPPRHPPVQCRVRKSAEMRKDAFYLRDIAKDLNKKGNRDLALKFMALAKAAYAKSCATEELEKDPMKRVGIAEEGPVGTLKPGVKGGKTRRRGKSKK